MSYLLDTNVLLRMSKSGRPEMVDIRRALGLLRIRAERLCYTAQNLVEFWNVMTRPAGRNGFGLSINEADREARRIERAFELLPDSDAVHHEWRRLVLTFRVSGVQVHDARLVAAMRVHAISHLLTLNVSDFQRYPEIIVLDPKQVIAQHGS